MRRVTVLTPPLGRELRTTPSPTPLLSFSRTILVHRSSGMMLFSRYLLAEFGGPTWVKQPVISSYDNFTGMLLLPPPLLTPVV